MNLPKENNIKNHLIIVDESLKSYGIATIKALHENHIPVYCHYKYNLKKSLAFANNNKVKFVIIIGEEYINKKYTLKNLFDSSQQLLSLEELVQQLN